MRASFVVALKIRQSFCGALLQRNLFTQRVSLISLKYSYRQVCVSSGTQIATYFVLIFSFKMSTKIAADSHMGGEGLFISLGWRLSHVRSLPQVNLSLVNLLLIFTSDNLPTWVKLASQVPFQ